MSLPKLPYTERRRDPQITEFKGVNYRDGIRDGELQYSLNMSSRRYPFLSPRRDRVTAREMEDPQAVWAGDKMVLVDGSDLIYDGNVIGTVAAGQKQFAAINSKLVIWPDKKYLDLNTGTLKDLEASVSSKSGATTTFTDSTVQLTGTKVASNQSQRLSWRYLPASGNTATEERYITVYAEEDVSFSGGVWTLTGGTEYSVTQIYNMTDVQRAALVGKAVMISDGTTALNYRETIDNSNIPDTSKPYDTNSTDGHFAVVKSVSVSQYEGGQYNYFLNRNADIKFDVLKADGLTDLSALFSVGEAVTVKRTNSPYTVYAEKAVIRGITGNTITFDSGTFSGSSTTTNAVTISRDVPDLDFICASENRLWGVSNSDEGRVWDRETQSWVTVHNRVIYASALGDPMSFYIYDGLSTDSYAVAVADAGDFTGCVGFSGDALFFKERKIYRIYGDYPASYTMYTYDVPGVAAGSHLSTGIINDTLYYLARDGVHAWSGGESTLVSYRLGPGPFSGGVAGVWGPRYYISMQDESDAWSLHVYDSLHNIWYREDAMQARGFAELGGAFYLLTGEGLDQVDTEGTVTVVPSTLTYTIYSTGLLTQSDLADWSASRYYGLSGLTGIRFLIPEKSYNYLVNAPQKYLTISYSTNDPGVVTVTAQEIIPPLYDPEWVTTDRATAPALAGTGSTILTATKNTYTVESTDKVLNASTFVDWRAVLADADETVHQRKNYRWLRLRMVIPAYSTVRVFVSFDNEPDQQMWETTPVEDFEGTVNIPLPPNRCDKIRVTLAGTGDMTLKSVIRAFNAGSVNTHSKGSV